MCEELPAYFFSNGKDPFGELMYSDHDNTNEALDRCHARDPWKQRWLCTRPKGHDGMHEGMIDDLHPDCECCARWDDEVAVALKV